MERTILKNLLAWKESPVRKPLLLTGLRQCGKTYICKEFGNRYFEDVAYFYFEGNELLKNVFEHDLDPHRILRELGSVIGSKEIVPGKTLVIFDEIQAVPRAITALKYFCEELRELHIVCPSSLLGVSLKRANISFPVGKVDRLQMYPLSFKEFLAAMGESTLCEGLAAYKLTHGLPLLYTQRLERALKLYYIVGGMPEAVTTWLNSQDFSKVDQVQDNLITDYKTAFAKYAPLNDVVKLGYIWDSIPMQLSKENNKFVFSHVKTGARARELEDALLWLQDAGLIYKLEMVEHPELPLAFNAQGAYFKVYLFDVGLLRKMANLSFRTILEGSDIYKNFKGSFTENFVLTEFIAQNLKPYFWRSDNQAEVNFIFEDQGRIIPVEAKAEISTRAKSYKLFCKKYKIELGFKLSLKNIGVSEENGTKTLSLPLYLGWRIKEYLNI